MRPIRSALLIGYLVFAFAAISNRVFAETASQAVPLGLTVSTEGVLMKDGKPYRGIGVNYFSAFYRTLRNPSDTSYEKGFEELARAGIPFARMTGSGFWPKDMQLYRENRESYFKRFDAVVRSAEKNGIGLIPSLFWNASMVPDLVGEPCGQWGNPKSRTHEFMRAYTREVVMRYVNSAAIWGWEFGNEYNNGADLPNAAQHRPKIVPNLGTPPTRDARDEWTHAMIRTAFIEFAKEVRKHDPHRIISTGNSIPRPSAWHQWKEGSWAKDTPGQSAEMLLYSNPDPVDVISVHLYGDEAMARLEAAMRTAATARKPLFVGEFGVSGPPTDDSRGKFAEMLARIESLRIPLAALWVYDLPNQKGQWSVTGSNERAWQLQAVAEANRRITGGLRLSEAERTGNQ